MSLFQQVDFTVPLLDTGRAEVLEQGGHSPKHVGIEVHLVVECGHFARVDQSEPRRAWTGSHFFYFILWN